MPMPAIQAKTRKTVVKAKPRPRKKRYDPLNPERIKAILERLDQAYPGATCALTHKSAWELLVATILSAQCTDVRVNLVTPVLFQKYPTPRDFAALKPEELEPDIRSTGFFRNKSKKKREKKKKKKKKEKEKKRKKKKKNHPPPPPGGERPKNPQNFVPGNV